MSTSVPYDHAGSPAREAAREASLVRTIWWLALGGAVASIVLGILVVVWPDATLRVGAALFGIWLLVHGVINIVNAVTASESDAARRTLTAVIGLLFVVAGIVCLRNLLVSIVVIATVIGLTWLIGGIIGLVEAFRGQATGAARAVYAGLGAITVLGGLVMLFWPEPTLTVIVWLTGLWLIIIGIVQLVLVLQTRPSRI